MSAKLVQRGGVCAPNRATVARVHNTLARDLGQLEPVIDWRICGVDSAHKDCPARLRQLCVRKMHAAFTIDTSREAALRVDKSRKSRLAHAVH